MFICLLGQERWWYSWHLKADTFLETFFLLLCFKVAHLQPCELSVNVQKIWRWRAADVSSTDKDVIGIRAKCIYQGFINTELIIQAESGASLGQGFSQLCYFLNCIVIMQWMGLAFSEGYCWESLLTWWTLLRCRVSLLPECCCLLGIQNKKHRRKYFTNKRNITHYKNDFLSKHIYTVYVCCNTTDT